MRNSKEIGDTLPDSFRVEIPLIIDDRGYYCIKAKINDKSDLDFIIDTKATNLAKEEDIKRFNANYEGTPPLSVRNIYGQKEKLPLYYFNSFEIPPLKFNKPLFYNIPSGNHLHSMMYKNVLGVNVLKHLYWKFSIDDQRMVLFDNNNMALQDKETSGFLQIENGLRNDNITLNYPFDEAYGQFTLDLGFLGEISINQQEFKKINQYFNCKKILTDRANSIDTTYIFDGLKMKINTIIVPHCQLIFSEKINRNLIGAKFMHRFNFILAYNYYKKGISSEHLYIQQIKNFETKKSEPYVNQFGFQFRKVKNEVIISDIEVGNGAYLMGLNVRDKIHSIDDKLLDLSSDDSFDINKYLLNRDMIRLKVIRENKIYEYQLSIKKTLVR